MKTQDTRTKVLAMLARRDGFTVVELLIAMALIVFIMFVINQTFSGGARTFDASSTKPSV